MSHQTAAKKCRRSGPCPPSRGTWWSGRASTRGAFGLRRELRLCSVSSSGGSRATRVGRMMVGSFRVGTASRSARRRCGRSFVGPTHVVVMGACAGGEPAASQRGCPASDGGRLSRCRHVAGDLPDVRVTSGDADRRGATEAAGEVICSATRSLHWRRHQRLVSHKSPGHVMTSLSRTFSVSPFVDSRHFDTCARRREDSTARPS